MFKKIKFAIILLFFFFIIGLFFYNPDKNKQYLHFLLDQAIKEKAWPGGVLIAGNNSQILLKEAFGFHTYQKKQKTRINDIFDLASLTKVIATTSMAMKLYDQNKLNLEKKVYTFFPAFANYNPDKAIKRLQKSKTYSSPIKLLCQLYIICMNPIWKKNVKIKNLLTHSSGLKDLLWFAKKDKNYQKKIRMILRQKLQNAPGEKEIYSDHNMIILAKILEKIAEDSLDKFTKKNIFSPLEMQYTFFNPSEKYYSRIVPTEYSNSKKTFIKGYVHDLISYVLGGVAGHAGLFSTGPDLARFSQMVLSKGKYKNKRIFKEKTINLFTTRAGIIKNNSHCLGWDSPSGTASGGIYLSDESYGHLGWTGTSLWIDKKNNFFVILLTNAVNPHHSFKKPTYYEWRQRIHSMAYQVLIKNSPNPKLKKQKRWQSTFNQTREKIKYIFY